MKRLLIVFIITICLGGCIYFITTLFPKDDLESEIPNEEETEESYEFDISYGKKTTLEEIETEIISTKDNKNIRKNRMVSITDFLVMEYENDYDKYKDVLNKIIEVTK